jgi:hypothetical protein
MLSFHISYPDLIKVHYFADHRKRGFGGERRAKDGEERVTLQKPLMAVVHTMVLIKFHMRVHHGRLSKMIIDFQENSIIHLLKEDTNFLSNFCNDQSD